MIRTAFQNFTQTCSTFRAETGPKFAKAMNFLKATKGPCFWTVEECPVSLFTHKKCAAVGVMKMCVLTHDALKLHLSHCTKFWAFVRRWNSHRQFQNRNKNLQHDSQKGFEEELRKRGQTKPLSFFFLFRDQAMLIFGLILQ